MEYWVTEIQTILWGYSVKAKSKEEAIKKAKGGRIKPTTKKEKSKFSAIKV